MKVKNLLVVAALLLTGAAQAQNLARTPEELLKGFDEQKAIQEARKKGVPETDIRGYVSGAKARYMQAQLIASGDTKTEVFNKKTTVINLGRGGGQWPLSSACANSDFSSLNYSNWTGDVTANLSGGTNYPIASWTSTGFNGNGGVPIITNTDPNYLSGTAPTDRHVIMNKTIVTPMTTNQATAFTNGYDPVCQNPGNSLYDMPVCPSNGQQCLRMGSEYNQYTSEELIYTFTVTPQTAQFTYQFAMVINQSPPPFGHNTGEQPAFVFQLLDNNNNQIGGNCGVYIKDANQASSDTSFLQSTSSYATGFNGDPVWYRKWHTVTVDLTAYMNQGVKASFQTLDCIYSGHFCYAYVSASCGALNAQVSGFCGTTGNVIMQAPTGFVSYQWYGPNNQTPIPGATSYTYSASGAQNGDVFSVDCVTLQGCTTKLNVTVAASNIVATAAATPSCRGGSTGTAGITVPGNPQFSYSWTPGSYTTTSISNQPAGPYAVTIHDLTGHCPDTTINVNIGETMPPLQTALDTLCGTQIALTAPTTAPYQWYDNNNNPISGATSQTYTVTNGAGGQHYTVTYHDPSTGCLDSLRTDLNQVTINFVPTSSPPCNGGNNGSITITGAGSNTFPTYDWNMQGTPPGSGTNVNMPPNAIQINSLPQGSYTISINPTGNTTCTYTTIVTLTQGVIPPPTLDTLKGCKLDNVSIPTTTVSGNTHNWYSGGTSLGSTYPYIANPITTGTVYTDTIRNSFGCISVYKAYMKEKSFKVQISAPEKIKCHDDSTGKLKVTATQEINGPLGTPYVFNWNYPSPYPDPAPVTTGVGVPQSSLETQLHAGTYTCVVTSGNCVATATYNLTNPALLPDDSLFSYFCPKDSIVWLYAESGHSTYNWLHNGVPVTPANNNDSIQVTPTTVAEYIVWYTIAGCRDTARMLFTGPSFHALVPDKTVNIFTPNDDKKNDFFYPFHDDNISQYEIDKQMETFEITIYNRWGKKVYETNEYAAPWDGKISGTPQDDGTYYYILKYKSNCSTKADIVTKHGFVQLLR